ncbi:M13 family metallopeptidase [Candidatus Marsarchaeota archaeon]|nr:M13 family metallopeptidase [Candidatus Marsarchaeota archaeon]
MQKKKAAEGLKAAKASNADPMVMQSKSILSRIGFSVKNMDRSVDPFDDFYSYACGTWLKTHKMPKGKIRINSFDELNDANLLILKSIAEKCANGKPDSHIERLVGNFYASYMNEELVEKLKFKPIMPIMKKIRDIGNKAEIPSLLGELAHIGLNAFFGSYVTSDKKNSEIYALYSRQGIMPLPNRDYYLSPKFAELRKEYVKHIRNMFVLYGSKPSYAIANAKVVMEIETELSKAQRTNVELRDDRKNYNKMTAKQISSRYKKLGLMEYYNALGAKGLSYVIIGQPEFFDKLDKMLASLDLNSIKAYLTWRVLDSYPVFLHNAVYYESFNFYGKKVSGQKSLWQRWHRGIFFVDGLIGEALGALYVKQNFDAKTKRRAEELVSNIRESFAERIKKVDWMSKQTKKRALEKLASINQKIGYPKKFRDYSKLYLKDDDLVGNFQKINALDIDRDMSRIGKHVDRDEWSMTTPKVNAYYSSTLNEIVFPAGILQPPFFDADKDDAVNYASIGGVIGHEMTHGFDDQGSLYDKNGNLKEWWQKSDRSRFEARAERIAELYGSLEAMPGMKVNGKLTLGENIADLGGINIAFDALRKALKTSKYKDKLIDGFTQEQRFFIAWAQIHKGKTTKEEAKRLLLVDPHSPKKFRGLIPAITHESFKKEFEGLSKKRTITTRHDNVNLW